MTGIDIIVAVLKWAYLTSFLVSGIAFLVFAQLDRRSGEDPLSGNIKTQLLFGALVVLPILNTLSAGAVIPTVLSMCKRTGVNCNV